MMWLSDLKILKNIGLKMLNGDMARVRHRKPDQKFFELKWGLTLEKCVGYTDI